MTKEKQEEIKKNVKKYKPRKFERIRKGNIRKCEELEGRYFRFCLISFSFLLFCTPYQTYLIFLRIIFFSFFNSFLHQSFSSSFFFKSFQTINIPSFHLSSLVLVFVLYLFCVCVNIQFFSTSISFFSSFLSPPVFPLSFLLFHSILHSTKQCWKKINTLRETFDCIVGL